MHINVLVLLHQYGYVGIFFILLTEMIGVPFPAETTLTISGVEWSQGNFSFVPLFLVAAIGNIVGSTIAYGTYLGRPVLLRYGRFVGISEERLKKAEAKFERRRHLVLLIGKFVAGVRVLVPYLAGINRMNFVLFSVYNTVSAFLWAMFFILEGRYLGLLWNRYHSLIEQYGVQIIVGIACVFSVLWVRRKVRQQRPTALANRSLSSEEFVRRG